MLLTIGINWIKTDNVPTVIELSSFTAKASNGRVKLEWVTETEIDNAGFNIMACRGSGWRICETQ